MGKEWALHATFDDGLNQVRYERLKHSSTLVKELLFFRKAESKKDSATIYFFKSKESLYSAQAPECASAGTTASSACLVPLVHTCIPYVQSRYQRSCGKRDPQK